MHSNPKKSAPQSGDLKHPTGETRSKNQVDEAQTLLDNCPASLFIIDRNYRYTAYNHAHVVSMLEVYGAHIKPDTSPLDYITNPEFHEMAKQKLDQALVGGKPFVDQEYEISKDGANSFFRINYTPIKDENGTVTRVSVFSEDITDLKKSEGECKEIEAFYNNLFMNISSVILAIDVETKSILNANQAACAFYGYTHSELTSLKLLDLAVLSEEELHSRIQKVASGETNHLQHAHRLASGEIREVEIYAGVTTFNGRQVNVAIVHDISARKAAENTLKLREEHYRSVFASMSEGIVVHDSSGAIISCNASAETILGLSSDQIQGKTPLDPNWRTIHEDGSPFPGETHPASVTLQTGQPSRNVIMGVHLPDGSLRWILINSQPVFLENSTRPSTVIVTFTDITERKIAEGKLGEILENLQDASYRRNLKMERYDYISPAIEQMSGITVEKTISMTTDMILPHMHADDQANIEQTILASTANPGKPYQIEYRFKHNLTNQYHWFQDRFTTTLDEQGHPEFRYGNVRDITNQKIAEEEKQEAEFRFRGLFEQSHDAIFILDFQGKHLTCNQRAADMMGYTIEEMRGLSVNETSAELQQSRQVIQQLLNGEHIPLYERLFKKRDGTVFPVEINVEMVRDSHGNPLHIQSVVRDISERKEAEKNLRENEEKYRSFIENSFDAISFVDENGNITEWNRAAETLTGIKKEDAAGKPYWDIQMQLALPDRQTPEFAERVKTNMLGMIQTGASPLFNRINNAEFIRSDGIKRIVEQIVFPIKMENGYGIRSVARDITERKTAEEKLRDSEERFRLLFERSHAIMMIIEPESGKILEANPAAEFFYGYTIEELRGISINHINTLPPETVTAERLLAMDEKRNFFVFPHRLKSGEMCTVEEHSSPIKMKGKPVLFSIIHDVTKKKQAEEKLIESEERFSTAFHSSQEAISISRISDGIYIDVNDSFCSIFEISRGQVIGRTSKDLDLWVNPEERKGLLETTLEKGKGSIFEAQYRTQNGRLGIIQASVGRTNIAGEECLLIFGRDITAQKQAEAALKTAHDELEQRVRERTAELQTAIVSLKTAAQVKDEFLSIMGHELRTPLNVILGSAQLLQESVYGELNPKQTKSVNLIEDSGGKLLKLINNILDFSKLQSRDVSLAIMHCSLGDLCHKVLRSVAISLEKKNLQINFSMTPDEIILRTDELRVRQILHNLLDNAIKFTPNDGRIGIDIIGIREYQHVKITVWDTGIGIKNEDLPRIFQPFVQLDARLTREYEGSGLGLALAQQLAEIFGGSINVESTVDKGSRFTVTLPWIEED